MTVTRMLAVLMTAGLVLSGLLTPVLAQQQSDPELELFPANLVLELTDEYVSCDGRQIVALPLFLSRATVDDLLFTEHAGQIQFGSHQMGERDRPRNVRSKPQNRREANQSQRLNQ